MSTRWSRVLIGGAVLSILLGAGTVITFADTGGVIFACVNNLNGDVRIVAQQVSCKNNETAAHWNIVGPQGPPGPQGPAGPQGPPGQSGPQQAVIGTVKVHSPIFGDDVTKTVEFTSGISVAIATGGGGGAGRAEVAPATFTKVIDKTSPDLFALVARGEMVTVTVDLCNAVIAPPRLDPTCTDPPYATFFYEGAHLTKLDATSSPMFANTVEEDVTLTYRKVTFTVDGKHVTFDQATNTTT